MKFLLLFTGLAAVLVPAQAVADVKRYALLVGVNRGHAHEAPLQYAESDVDQVATTLESVAGFAPEGIVRLKRTDASAMRAALIDLNLRIQKDVAAGTEAVLFVYYSGHGSGGELHLGGTSLATDELSKLVRLSAAKLKLLFLDACRAGSLTRVKGTKGGRQVAPFRIELAEELRNEGFAIVTSSAAGEDAQESDALRSSIFTHHFLAGMRGLADANRDRLVTLGEAYAYAYAQSLKTSMNTVVGSQHATFDYDLRGRADPVLADLRSSADQAELVLATEGDYLVVPEPGGGALVEAHVDEAGALLRLPAARYRVKLRTPARVMEGDLALLAGERQHLSAADMRPLPLAQAVRKGEVSASLAQGPMVAGTMHGPIAPGYSPTIGGMLGWGFELPHITLMPRMGFGRSDADRATAQNRLTELSAELAALYVLDFGRLSVAPLLSVGAAFLSQEFITGGTPTTRNPVALVTTVGLWSAVPVGRGFSVEANAELATFYLGRQDAVGGTDLRTGTVTYRLGLGIGYRY
jgi:hypothetical protein